MTDKTSETLLTVARMYYVQSETMDAIAHQLGVSRSTISRLLKEARDRGLVRVTIVDPERPLGRMAELFDKYFGVQAHIVQVRPGLSGIGSIVFRDEEELMHASTEPERFYDEVIMPYKGALEEWYVAHQGLWIYLASIFATAWVVLLPKSQLVWRLFPGLPSPPAALHGAV